MSTFYRPIRRGPRLRHVAAVLACLPLLLTLVFLGYRAHDYRDDMPTAGHPLACQTLDTDWTLEWSFWDGWHCQPDQGSKLIPVATWGTWAGCTTLKQWESLPVNENPATNWSVQAIITMSSPSKFSADVRNWAVYAGDGDIQNAGALSGDIDADCAAVGVPNVFGGP